MKARWENECISWSALDSPGLDLTPDRGGVYQGIFPWLITHICRGDGCRQVVTDPLKEGY